MSDSWIGEIRLFTYGRVPRGWHLCDGSILQITSYQALFTLLGAQYGGDGTKTFALPDLRGRVPASWNPSDPNFNRIGLAQGVDAVALTAAQLPVHTHSVGAFDAVGTAPAPLNNFPAAAASTSPQIYGQPTAPATTSLNPGSLVPPESGAGTHENRQPTMALSWCICMVGFYPQRN